MLFRSLQNRTFFENMHYDKIKKMGIFEIQKGHIRNVYALRLGYGCYITNESPETYVLYPTWICDCDYIGDPKEKINVSAYNIEKDFNKKYTFKTLVINAQTGEMDDPYLSKKEQIFCPTIITWEDAQ